MAKFISNKERQSRLDERKWLDGIKYGKDMCGEYDYCALCYKTEEFPCAKAYNRMQKANRANRCNYEKN